MHYRRGEVTRQLGPRHGAIARPMRFLKSDQAVYQENDGTFWVDREWQDPASGITWHTYEDLGVAVDEQQAASLPNAQARMQSLLAQSQPGCRPQTSVVVLEGTVGLQPNTTVGRFEAKLAIVQDQQHLSLSQLSPSQPADNGRAHRPAQLLPVAQYNVAVTGKQWSYRMTPARYGSFSEELGRTIAVEVITVGVGVDRVWRTAQVRRHRVSRRADPVVVKVPADGVARDIGVAQRIGASSAARA